jgi:hypothetical protein
LEGLYVFVFWRAVLFELFIAILLRGISVVVVLLILAVKSFNFRTIKIIKNKLNEQKKKSNEKQQSVILSHKSNNA